MIRKQFFKNVLPSVLAFTFSGIYAIVDGFFVGQNIGDLGLAGIGIAYPIVALIQAIGTGIGMGGSILIAISLGEGEDEKQKKYLGNTLLLLALSCVIFTIGLYFSYTFILKLFGAEGELLRYAEDYIRVIIFGASFQILSTGIVPIIRNYNGSFMAMASMIAGFVTNVILDWVLVLILQMGMFGAALATVISQAVTLGMCVIFLLYKKKLIGYALFKPLGSFIKKILIIGASPFGLTLSSNITAIIMNKGALVYGGDNAVAVYAVIGYVTCIVTMLFQGIGDGAQPLISRYYGAKDYDATKTLRKMAYIFAGVIGIICSIAIFFLREYIPILFGASSEVAASVKDVLPIFIIGFIFAGFLRITTSYFYAIKKNTFSYILIYSEPILLLALVLFVVPLIIGLNGVWLSVPITQVIISCAGLFMLWKSKKKV